MTRKHERELNRQEQTLWEIVTRSIKPLAARTRPKEPVRGLNVATPDCPVERALPLTDAPVLYREAGRADSKPAADTAPALPPMVTMIRRERRAVVRGISNIDAKLDLHGLRQDEAQRHLRAFIIRSAAAGYRTVLVVTGKGAPTASEGFWNPGQQSRGVLRRLAPLLLESAELRDIVLGYETADKRHGGAGALYVRLRRRSG